MSARPLRSILTVYQNCRATTDRPYRYLLKLPRAINMYSCTNRQKIEKLPDRHRSQNHIGFKSAVPCSAASCRWTCQLSLSRQPPPVLDQYNHLLSIGLTGQLHHPIFPAVLQWKERLEPFFPEMLPYLADNVHASHIRP